MKRKRSQNKKFSSSKKQKFPFKISENKALPKGNLDKMSINYLSNPESEETGSQHQPNPKLTQIEETGSQNQPNPKLTQIEETGSQNQPNLKLTQAEETGSQNQQEMAKLIDIVRALNEKSKVIIAQTELMKNSCFGSSTIEDLSTTAKDCNEIAKLLADLIQSDM